MTLEDEIAEAQDFIDDPPKNESNTCEWIILPLLWAAGYAKRDIVSRMVDSTGQYPDYTLLPNHFSATYYLEAKSWSEALEDKYVNQALNYANHNGKRFVVLSNGQSWRLYDNAIQGLLADKLITEVALQDTPQITSFLTAISKTEALEGSLDRLAAEVCQRKLQEAHNLREQQQREQQLQSIRKRQMEIRNLLDTVLPDLLNAATGELVLLMTDYLSHQKEFDDISPETLSLWFHENLSQPSADREEQAINADSTQIFPPSLSEKQGGVSLTLNEIQGRPIAGKISKPIALQSPDGVTVAVSSWVQLAETVVRWLLLQSCPMPLPFEYSHPKRWFLNRIPEHKRQDQRKKFKEISAGGKTVYMDADRSSENRLKDIHALCLKMQVAPTTFRITMLF